MKTSLSASVIALIAFYLILPAQPCYAEDLDLEESRQMTADLDGVLLKDFIMFVSRFTGHNIVFREDRIPAVKVTMHTQTPMREPELMAVLDSVLAGNNLELVSRGDVLYVLHTPLVQGIAEPFVYPAGEGESYELVSTVIQLGPRAPVKQAAEMLKPFLSKHGIIQEIAPARSILIRDTRQNISRISDIIDTLQKIGPTWKTAMISLHEADAMKTSSKVIDLYTGLVERGQMSDSPVVLPVEWSNSIMVAGTADQIETVRGLVRDLDSITERTAGLKIYSLKNARAETAAEVLRNLLSVEQPGQNNSDSRLIVSPDRETNSILVLADPHALPQVTEIIAHLDRPLAQVFVEALIVETTLEHSQDFGVEWLAGGGGRDGIGIGGFIHDQTSGLAPLLSQAAPPVAASGFTIGALGNSITYAGRKFSTLGALVNFIKTARDFNILSTPQIMTLDNSEAEVFIGENRRFESSERLDEQSRPIKYYDYRDIGIRLQVTPTINTETGMIRLEVVQEVQNYDKTEEITMNRNTRTSVQLPSGSTMVISGLIQNSFSHSREAVPGLSRVPGLGWMFRREALSAPKSTLMVFLSARIIETLEQADHLTQDRMERVRETRQTHEDILEREFWGTSEKQRQSFGIDLDELGKDSSSEEHE